MKLVSVEGNKYLARDKNTGAILNLNDNEAYQARQRKELRLKKAEEEQQLINRLEKVEDGINKINDLILRLLDEKNGI